MDRILVCVGEQHIFKLIKVNLERQGYEVAMQMNNRLILSDLISSEFQTLILGGDFQNPTSDEIKAQIESNPDLAGMRILILDRAQMSGRGPFN